MESSLNSIFDFVFSIGFGFAVLLLVALKGSIKFVPQNRAFVIERFGKYRRTLVAGLNFILPFLDKVAYNQSFKEHVSDVPSQSAITKDHNAMTIDGVLYMKVLDPYKVSYGVDDYDVAVTQLAQTTMRSEIGKIQLDKTFEDRESLNAAIVQAINEAAEPWGVQVLRYEIKDIEPPRSVLEAMERQMKAERDKRATVLDSEGERQAAINVAEGEKQAKVLSAEGDRAQQIPTAQGEVQAIELGATAKAMAIRTIGEAAATGPGQKAVQLDLATQAIMAKQNIAKESTVVLMGDKASDAGSVVAEAVAVVTAMNKSGAFNPDSA